MSTNPYGKARRNPYEKPGESDMVNPMPRPNKGFAYQYPLNLTESEREGVERLRAKFAENDISLSFNDAVRAFIRHGFDPAPADLDGVTRAIERHSSTCEWCTPDVTRCPFGWRLIAIRQCFQRKEATPPRATTSGRRPLLPPPPGATP